MKYKVSYLRIFDAQRFSNSSWYILRINSLRNSKEILFYRFGQSSMPANYKMTSCDGIFEWQVLLQYPSRVEHGDADFIDPEFGLLTSAAFEVDRHEYCVSVF